jgi:serine/threonine protein kinase
LAPAAGADVETRLDDHVAEALDRLESEGEPGFERLLADHPDLAARVRRRVDTLRGGGLLDAPEKPLPIEIPERLGEFRLVRCLGSGGMGVVYLAEQDRPKRLVALKMLLPAHLFFPHARERFRREVEIVARLNHPGIVPIYTVGEDQGLPYFAMECVEGCSLAEILRAARGRDPSDLTGAHLRALVRQALHHEAGEPGELERESSGEPPGAPPAATQGPDDVFAARVFSGTWADASLRLLEQVGDALAHAHARGVLHRDVKPSNVMVRADGRAQLVDFGLAQLQGSSKITRSGANPGSLPYMAPEQLDATRGAPDVRTDIYALGVTLYELLTLRSAFDSHSREATARRILDGDALPLRRVQPRLPRDFATACAQAMDPEPGRRYATAADFARDLEAAREGRPIAARPLSLVASLWRRARRHPVHTVVAAALVFAAATFLATFDLSERFFTEKAMTLANGRDRGRDATQRVMVAIANQERPLPEDLALFESEVEDPRFAKRWEDLLRSPLDAKARTDVEESLKPRNVPTPGLIRLLQPLAGVLDLTPNFIFDVPPAVGAAHVWDVEIGRDGAPPDAPRVFRTLRVEQRDGDPGPMRIEIDEPGLPVGAYTWRVVREPEPGAAASPETESATARFEIVDLARLQPMLDRIAELRDGDPGLSHVARLMNAATYLRFHCARLAFQELADFPPDALPENQSYRMLLEAHAQAIEIDAENGYAGGGDAAAPPAAEPATAHAGDAVVHPKN